MPVTAFSHYNLRASRDLLEDLCAFYRDVVGLSIGPRPALQSHGYWLYAGGEAVLHLSELKAGEAPRSTEGRSTFDHAAFKCSGREAFERILAGRGIVYRTARIAELSQVQLFFTDPAGNGIELNFEEA